MAVGMFDSFITRGWFDPEAAALWNETATLQAWLDVEAALAAAEAELGLVPQDCAEIIATKARTELFDLADLEKRIATAQHPFVPVLAQFAALCGEPAAGFLHLGATTQNIFDTAASLQMRSTVKLVLDHLDETLDALCALAGRHADTVQAGRTHGQHALPMTFGFKLAGWIDELGRHRARLAERFSESFVASLGGAIGTHAALAKDGAEVERRMAARLGLQPAGLAIRSSYDRVADYLSSLCLIAGTLEKIAGDIVFMQRTEIGEVSESFHLGKVGSSTMPQKRNPSTALKLVSLCRLLRGRLPLIAEAMLRMDEGDSSATNVTDVTVPEIALFAASATAMLRDLVLGLNVHPDAMARNLDLTGGLIVSEAIMMTLSAEIGRHAAHRLLYDVAQAVQSENMPFAKALRDRPELHRLSAETLDALLDPQGYTGASGTVARSIGWRGEVQGGSDPDLAG
ncbi:class-II fumarase/aspartase family protein [Natronohydrobacter thiooxidans]|uniref:class-II fumarase/aspartase family protein n=1 Tax=Natronohydrobacter thiooxidans TaxID=87172 RepID=UPI0008FF1850|nr:adenylosuccinate lyase family protein [Natronohydrobacter thiooxidans]